MLSFQEFALILISKTIKVYLSESYTETAKNALFIARYEACLHGARSVEPEHVLLGLLRADPGLFEIVSTRAIQTDQIRGIVEAQIFRGAQVDSGRVTPLSRAAEKVLRLAVVEGHDLRHDYLGTEHILLGLLRPRRRFSGLSTNPSLTARILSDSGFDVEEIILRIRSGLVNSQSPRKSPAARLGSSSGQPSS